MLIFGAIFLHIYLLHPAAAAAGEQEQQVTVVGEKGKSVLLPCLERPDNSTLEETRWKKSGKVMVTRVYSQPPPVPGHFSVLDDGRLNITSLLGLDEDLYECDPNPKNDSASRSILLLVADGPAKVAVDVTPVTLLPNGTGIVQKGDDISFKCSSESYPSQNLTWVFGEVTECFGNGSSLSFKINNIQPDRQGNYTCKAQNLLSNRTVTWSQELLVYYASDRHPDCAWEPSSQPDLVVFSCSWCGGYPAPTLQVFLDSPENSLISEVKEKLQVTLNRTKLSDGQNINCLGRHVDQQPSHEKSCSFTLVSPYPEGQPLVAALEGSSVTLSCSEDKALPPAKTVWKRGTNQRVILPSSKYVLSVQGPVLSLTIVNVTKEDEGVFFCWSENVLAVKELEVYLTVRSSADGSGVVVGVFISVLIVVAGIALGLLAYSRRDRICLSLGFRDLEEDATDVMSLVESDDEEVFHDAVPRLPPVSNGHAPVHATTFVEIHRIQSSDHEDNANDADPDHVRPEE